MTIIQEKPLEEFFAQEPQFSTRASKVRNVAQPDRTRYLRIALRLVGLTFIVGIYTLVIVWPSGWAWHAGQSHHLPHYLQMILGVYATLGVFLLIASRHPAQHRSLIAFTAWSSLVHASIMALQALYNAGDRGHLLGDVPALVIVGAVLIALAPAKQSGERVPA